MNGVHWYRSFLTRFPESGLILVLLLCSFLFASTQIVERRDAFLKNPNDIRVKYEWAQVAPCSTAVRLYREITAGTSVPDTIKSAAFSALGEYYFAKKEYKTAAEQYKSSVNTSGTAVSRDHWAQALFCDGQYDAALTLWNALALEQKKEFGVTADFYSGCVALHSGKFADALSRFEKCGKPETSRPITLEALSGKRYSLEKLGRQSDAAIAAEQLKKFNVPPIEWPVFSGKIAANEQSPVPPVTTDSTRDAELSGFTVQVGAFSTIDNATALQKKLSQQFENVSVATVTLEDKTFYRVRVGSFATREDAERYAVDSIQKAGITGKAVPKKMPDQN
jgi:septal ring-binding cell division protein DamX